MGTIINMLDKELYKPVTKEVVEQYEYLVKHFPASRHTQFSTDVLKTHEGIIKSYVKSSSEAVSGRCGLGEFGLVDKGGEVLAYIEGEEFRMDTTHEEYQKARTFLKDVVSTTESKARPFVANECVVAVDFDGTLTVDPNMGGHLALRPFAKEAIKQLHEDGVQLVLWTCRTGLGLQEAMDFLDENEILTCFESINDQVEGVLGKYPENARKVGADVYIDDKSIGMGSVNWLELYEYITGQSYLG